MTRPWKIFLLSWALFSVLSALWAIATPISGGPDEPAHIVKAAAVVRGELTGTAVERGIEVTVPRYVAETHRRTCFAFHPGRPASCAPAATEDPGELVTATTTAGLYNPTYYALVGWPSLLIHDDGGIYAMRFAGAVLSSLFLAFAAMLVSGWRRGGFVVTGILAAVTPMVLFLNGVVNPNSVETTATLAAFAALLALIVDPQPERMRTRILLLLISAVIAANMRGTSPVWLAVVLLIPLALLTREQWQSVFRHKVALWTSLSVAAVGLFLALLWTLLSNSLGAGITGSTKVTDFPGVGTSPLIGFFTMLSKTFDFSVGMIAEFGWLDTFAPPFVYLIWSLIVGALLFAGFVALRRRSFLVFLALLASVIVVPATIQAAYVTLGGYIWQGRYTLPLFVCLLLGTAALLTGRLPAVSRRTLRRSAVLLGVLWALAQFTAFAWTLKRYAVGVEGTWKALVVAPSWQPPGGVIVVLVATAVALITSVVAWSRWVAEPTVPGGPQTDPVPTFDTPSRTVVAER
jgi:hypothetical protein